MSRVKDAVAKHDSGYNCCQAVACAYADAVGVDESLMYKMAEGFGAGMGTTMGICGAIAGAAILAGMVNSDGDIDHPAQTKAATYKIAGQMQKAFAERAGRLICREIKTGNNGKPFTSCDDCVRIAAEIVEEFLDI